MESKLGCGKDGFGNGIKIKQVVTGIEVRGERFNYFVINGFFGKFCFMFLNIDFVINVFIYVYMEIVYVLKIYFKLIIFFMGRIVFGY